MRENCFNAISFSSFPGVAMVSARGLRNVSSCIGCCRRSADWVRLVPCFEISSREEDWDTGGRISIGNGK